MRAEDSHRPEAVRLEKFDPPPPRPLELTGEAESKSIAQLTIRAVRPPLAVEVLMSRGAPEFVRGPNLGARVVSIAGPWRRDGEWWHASDDDAPSLQLTMKTNGNFRRDYYELALADGGVYRVYRDLNSAQWFVDGIYD